ncbi:hypothetical protein RI367_007337 [Sorochytrium milnesiophthora]
MINTLAAHLRRLPRETLELVVVSGGVRVSAALRDERALRYVLTAYAQSSNYSTVYEQSALQTLLQSRWNAGVQRLLDVLGVEVIPCTVSHQDWRGIILSTETIWQRMEAFRVTRLAAVLVLFIFAVHASPPSDIFGLTIAFSNTLFGQETAYTTTINGTAVTQGGYARLATAFQIANATKPSNSVLLRFNQANVIATNMFSQTFRGSAEKQIMGMFGVQATAIGVDDMFTDLRTLANNLYINASYAVVCANCQAPTSHPLHSVLQRYQVFSFPYFSNVTNTTTTFKVGVTSVVADNHCSRVLTCVENGVTVFRVLPRQASLQSAIDDLNFVEQVNYTVVLTAGQSGTDGANDMQTLSTLSGSVLLLSGDTYSTMNAVRQIPSANPSQSSLMFGLSNDWGTQLGLVNLQISNSAVASYSGTQLMLNACSNDTLATPTGCIPQDPTVQSIVAAYDQQVAAYAGTVVGYIPQTLPKAPCTVGECLLGNLLTDAILWRMSPSQCNYALVNQGSIRVSLLAGNATIGAVKATVPFSNLVTSLAIKGKYLLDALNNGFSTLGMGPVPQVGNMQVDVNLARTIAPLGLASSYGLRVAAVRMLNLTTNVYEDLQMEQVYRVCINDYLSKGLDGYTVFATQAINPILQGPQQDEVLSSYIRTNPTLPVISGRITNVTSNLISTDLCTYPPLVATDGQGSVTDLCSQGRRALSNVTMVISPTTATTRSIALNFSGLFSLFGDGRDAVTIYSGTSATGSPLTFTYNNTIVAANWTNSLPNYTINVFASQVAINYVSLAEKTGPGLALNYASSSNCPPGYMLNGPSCAACASGMYWDQNTMGCFACPAGSYSPVPASIACTNCSTGYYTSSAGYSQCTFCDTSLGRVLLPGSAGCVCGAGLVDSAEGCVTVQGVSLTSTIVSSVLVVLLILTGYFVYRRRMVMLQRKVLHQRRVQTAKLRVLSRGTRIILDLSQFVFFVSVDVVDVVFDWLSLLKYSDVNIRTVFTVVVILGTIISAASIITRCHYEWELYVIHTRGVEVSARRRQNKRNAKLLEEMRQYDLGSDPHFVELMRKLMLARRELRLTQFVVLPCIFKAIPVLVVESLLVVSHGGVYGTLLVSYLVTVSMLALNLHIISQWPHVLLEYRTLKLDLDKVLKGAGMARLSNGVAVQSGAVGMSHATIPKQVDHAVVAASRLQHSESHLQQHPAGTSAPPSVVQQVKQDVRTPLVTAPDIKATATIPLTSPSGSTKLANSLPDVSTSVAHKTVVKFAEPEPQSEPDDM